MAATREYLGLMKVSLEHCTNSPPMDNCLMEVDRSDSCDWKSCYCVPQLCTSVVYLSCVPQLCTSVMYLSCVSQLCTSVVYLSCVPQLCTSVVYLNCCTSVVYLSCVPQLCTSVVYLIVIENQLSDQRWQGKLDIKSMMTMSG